MFSIEAKLHRFHVSFATEDTKGGGKAFPMLLDREVDFITAMITSVRAVVTSPAPMIGWALIITVTMLLSMLPVFAGLLVTLPVLGHTTWHLYRKLVPEPQPGEDTSAS